MDVDRVGDGDVTVHSLRHVAATDDEREGDDAEPDGGEPTSEQDASRAARQTGDARWNASWSGFERAVSVVTRPKRTSPAMMSMT